MVNLRIVGYLYLILAALFAILGSAVSFYVDIARTLAFFWISLIFIVLALILFLKIKN